jgi:hypothetical protein
MTAQERWQQNAMRRGMCRSCGRRPHAPGIQKCLRCKKRSQKVYRRWYRRNRARALEYGKRYGAAHRKAISAYSRARRQRLRVEVIRHYGGRCACCGEKRYEFLTIDHINGKGGAHRKRLARNRVHLWLWSHGYPKGFQVLCFNCNCAKGIYGVCPHKRRRASA